MLKQLIKRPTFWALLVITACAGWYWRPADRSTLFPVIFANDKMGYVNLDGRVVMSDHWDGVTAFDDKGRAFVYRGEAGGFIQRDGSVERWWPSEVSGSRVNLEMFGRAEGMDGVVVHDAVRRIRLEGNNWHTNSNGQLDKEARWPGVDDVTPRNNDAKKEPLYKGATVRSRKWGTRLDFGDSDLAPVEKDGKFGFVNRFGDIAIPLMWDQASTFDVHGVARVINDDKFGLIARTGKLVVPLGTWAEVGEFDAAGFAAVRKDGKWGAIDRTGKLILPLKWDNPPSFDKGGLALVRFAGKFGFIDRTGKLVGELEWDHAYSFGDDELACVSQFRKWGFIDRTGNVVIPIEWDSAHSSFDEKGMAGVCKSGK
ncbi:MAG: WG repeat-containing protein [Gemmataceae bacterium]|nr:WG repeat-containing protein [Gemmataceae bacterium]